MPPETTLFERSWKVGKYTVTLTAPKLRPRQPLHASMEWSPSMPTRLTEAELAQYRAGRDAALLELAKTMGGTIAVVEV